MKNTKTKMQTQRKRLFDNILKEQPKKLETFNNILSERRGDLKDADLNQNACFFYKVYKGGGSNPFIKILANIWYAIFNRF